MRYLLPFLLLLPCPARACTVPVFRYALEHWKPASYSFRLFHHGNLTPAQQGLLDSLTHVNLQTTLIDRGRPLSLEMQTLWKHHGDSANAPRGILSPPADGEDQDPVWSCTLAQGELKALVESPLRRRLIQSLSQGTSAVWVLLLSGNRAADEEARGLLEGELRRLELELHLPELDAKDRLLARPALRLKFEMLFLPRADPSERLLKQMLLQTEGGLEEVQGPIAFPVIGRGRSLVALHGEDLSAAQIERWASFLCGPCSCRVKELNPGIDLLLQANWEALLELQETPTTSVEIPAVGPAIPPGVPVRERASRSASEEGVAWWFWGGALGAGMVLTGWTLWRRPRG